MTTTHLLSQKFYYSSDYLSPRVYFNARSSDLKLLLSDHSTPAFHLYCLLTSANTLQAPRSPQSSSHPSLLAHLPHWPQCRPNTSWTQGQPFPFYPGQHSSSSTLLLGDLPSPTLIMPNFSFFPSPGTMHCHRKS